MLSLSNTHILNILTCGDQPTILYIEQSSHLNGFFDWYLFRVFIEAQFNFGTALISFV